MRHITREYVTKAGSPVWTGSLVGAEKLGDPPPPQQLELVILSSSKVRTKSCIPASHSRTVSSFFPQKSALFFLLFRSWEQVAGSEPQPPLSSARARGRPVGSAGLSVGPRSLGLGSGPPEGG